MIYAINYQAHAAASVVMAAQPLAQSAITLVGMFIITYRINATLALIAIAVVPFLYYSVGYYATHIQDQLMKVKGMEGESLSIIHEAMSMLRVIVAFGRERHEFGRFRKQGEQAVTARIHLTVRQTIFSLTVNFISAVGTSVVLGFGAYQAYLGRLTTGELLVVLAYIASIYRPLEAISTTIGSLQDQFVSLRIAFGLMDTEPEIRDAPDAISLGRARGEITFENVQFSYKGRPGTLRDISFGAKANEVIAIAGPTGAGKTTLVSLLPRFYDVTGGRILLDGVDVRKISLRSLRDQISIVLQEPLLFSGTISANIRYGRLSASMAEIIAAAEAANAHRFITALPQKYDTMVGERGVRLSGGERQRIAVARAFLKDAPILILDEPTSSIDSKTESVILDALDRLIAGRTTLMIAHRLSTIRNADTILVMNEGEIVQGGTHEELIAGEGLYRQLFEMQTARRQRRDAMLASAEMVQPKT
jgi:ATP-binding cassette subfamily B protein